jgi:hypothetical protein
VPVRAPGALHFTDDTGRHELWYEDARSFQANAELKAAHQLAGISAWVLGQEDPGVWELLGRDYRVRHPRAQRLTGTFEQRSKAAARNFRAN